MKAVILSATPSGDTIDLRPRPEIGGKPVAWHIMRRLASFGITDFIMCGDGDGNRDLVTDTDTDTDTDTGWRVQAVAGSHLKQAEPHIDEDLFVVAYGDGLADIDVPAMISFSRAQGCLATVTAVRPAEDYVPAGFFVLRRGVFDYLSANSVLDQEPLVALARDGELCAYRHDGFWQRVADERDRVALDALWASGRAPWAA